jgi:(p)ppGpp synthase/HD superfamily hydrolase
MRSFKQFIVEREKSQFEIAYDIAKKAHANQTDLSGGAYIHHVNSVIKAVSNRSDKVKAVAALHDVVEDTKTTLVNLKNAGISDDVLQAVDAITKRKGEDRVAYYNRVKKNNLARIVKIADIKNNADERRLKKLPKDLADRLRQKYKKALDIVESVYLDKEEVLLFETVLIERAKSDITSQPWSTSNLKNKGREELQKIYNEILDFVLKVKNEFVRLIHRAADKKEDKVLFNIKQFDSFIDKTAKRGKDPKQMSDIIRGAILGSTQDDVERIVKNLRKFGRIHKYEVKKLTGGDKFGYYGSHHVDVQVGNVIAEIQVMTKRLWTYKKAAHDIYDELRSQTDAKISDAEVRKKLTRSRELFHLGNR